MVSNLFVNCKHVLRQVLNIRKSLPPIFQLPDEILCNIFFEMDFNTLTIASLVCKRWSSCSLDMLRDKKKDQESRSKIARFRIKQRSLFFKNPKQQMCDLLTQVLSTPQQKTTLDCKTSLFSFMLIEEELHMFSEILTAIKPQPSSSSSFSSLTLISDSRHIFTQLSNTYLHTFGKDFLDNVFKVYMYDYLQGSLAGASDEGGYRLFATLLTRFCSLAEDLPVQIRSFLKLLEQNRPDDHLNISCILVINWIVNARREYVVTNGIATKAELTRLTNCTQIAQQFFTENTADSHIDINLQRSFAKLRGTLRTIVARQKEVYQEDNSGKVNCDLLCRSLEQYLLSGQST